MLKLVIWCWNLLKLQYPAIINQLFIATLNLAILRKNLVQHLPSNNNKISFLFSYLEQTQIISNRSKFQMGWNKYFLDFITKLIHLQQLMCFKIYKFSLTIPQASNFITLTEKYWTLFLSLFLYCINNFHP